jgi:hypothetical protein
MEGVVVGFSVELFEELLIGEFVGIYKGLFLGEFVGLVLGNLDGGLLGGIVGSFFGQIVGDENIGFVVVGFVGAAVVAGKIIGHIVEVRVGILVVVVVES